MTGFSIIVPGTPVGKGRPRFTGKGHTYTDDKTAGAEAKIGWAWQHAGRPQLHDAAIHLRVLLVLVRPKGHTTTRGALSAEGLRSFVPARRKPDIDNALKLVMDALNGLAWRDDVQIVKAEISKQWGDEPRTYIDATVIT